MPAFRIQYKNIFLTYPQSDLDNNALADFLLNKLDSFTPLYIVVSKELHEDGHPHHHALIQLGDKPNIANAEYFDFEGRHPNIQKAPKPKATIADTRNYVIKDGDFVERGEFVNAGTKRNRDTVYAEALELHANGGSREEVEEIIKAGAPRDYFVASSQITGRLNALYADSGLEYDQSDHSVLQFPELPESVWTWYSQHSLVSIYPAPIASLSPRPDTHVL